MRSAVRRTNQINGATKLSTWKLRTRSCRYLSPSEAIPIIRSENAAISSASVDMETKFQKLSDLQETYHNSLHTFWISMSRV